MQSDKKKLTPEMEEEIKVAYKAFTEDLNALCKKWQPRLDKDETYLPGIRSIVALSGLADMNAGSVLASVDKAVCQTAERKLIKFMVLKALKEALGSHSDSD
ncbi:hypothetical protein [Yaravirus sp. 'brasiliensis']|uniref:Uncharacterized protein n=1 Tax=Yaravirus sp. 'brasiliensis' TaxID=2739681 RepID=A0AAE7E2I2_9VIRU|nr:hypothetical protein QKS73_gp18 [Yaravirus brasiliensis]QKE44391.1 hypothetical protein [Yaravirus brasiliensis]